ncbi:MAG TPA: hypothetical protein DCZ94_05370 [Lentisphaeria bacterium]|nr:MAG: hypothetical protein A2X48_00940 [Lentisphaerae bacterium GWF2_49_21]HBC86368.1 hypothetical protein [Lentisphaeria bacterium]
MADSAKKQNGGEELLANVTRLESDLLEIEKARKQQALITRVGLVLVLLAIMLFAWNMWNFSRSLMQPASLDQFSKKLGEDMQGLMGDPEIRRFQDSLMKQVFPEISNQMIERFKKDLPNFQAKGKKVFSNIQLYLEGYMKDELEKALAESIVEIEKEIHTTYPKVSTEKIEKVLKEAESVFIEHITMTLEKRVEMLFDDFEKMEKTIDKFSQLDDMKQLEKMEINDIKLALIESVLELGIYEINPEKGNRPAAVHGGAK